MRKKGQGLETLFYIAGGVIAALAIYYGINSAMQAREQAEEFSLELLKETIRVDVDRLSSQYGSNRSLDYLLGQDFNRICFTDTTNNTEIAADPSTELPAIIRDSAADNSSNNVFLLGPNPEAFYGGEIRGCKSSWKCFPAAQSRAIVRLYGGGGFADFDPCEAVDIFSLIPACSNESGSPIYERYYSLPSNFELNAIAKDPRGITPSPVMKTEWIVINATGDIERGADFGCPAVESASPSEQDCSYVPNAFGVYKITMIGKSVDTGLQCRVTFIREVAEKENNYPRAEITSPAGDFLPLNEIVEFNGNVSDKEANNLQYWWVWEDELESSLTSIISDENYSPSQTTTETRTFTNSGQYVTIKLVVKDSDGLVDTDARVYSVGNFPPWIVLNEPLRDAILPSADVEFNFTPMDNEQPILDCQLLLDGSRIPLGSLSANEHHLKTVPGLAEGEHAWAVACSDGISTNTSETRRFTIVPMPVLACFVSGDCGTGMTEMLSISGVTNAHVSQDHSKYSQKLCCNLTMGSITKNLQPSTSLMCPQPETFITLSAQNNSHAAEPTDALYGAIAKVCFDTTETGIGFSCRVESSGADCAEDEACVLALSSLSNAHVESCSSGNYANRICCKAVLKDGS